MGDRRATRRRRICLSTNTPLAAMHTAILQTHVRPLATEYHMCATRGGATRVAHGCPHAAGNLG